MKPENGSHRSRISAILAIWPISDKEFVGSMDTFSATPRANGLLPILKAVSGCDISQDETLPFDLASLWRHPRYRLSDDAPILRRE